MHRLGMKRLCGWVVCVGLAALGTAPPAAGACRVYEGKWQGVPSVILENDLIRVTVLPDQNGVIAEYFYKPGGFNVFMVPEFSSFPVTRECALNDSNYGGYKDWDLATGVIKNVRRYDTRIVTNSPAVASLLVSRVVYNRTDRLMTIRERSTLLDLVVETTNLGTVPIRNSYWAHIMITPSGRMNNREVFLAPVAVGRRSSRQADAFVAQSDGVAEVTNTMAASGSASFAPAQGWKAVLDRTRGTLYAEFCPMKDIGADGYFYFWRGQKGGETGNPTQLLSSETVFSEAAIEPGKTVTRTVSLAQIAGLSGLSYASRSVCLFVTPQAITVGRNGVKVEVTSPQTLKGARVKLLIVDGEGRTVGTLLERKVNLDPTRVQRFDATVPAAVKTGTYGVNVSIYDRAKRLLDESPLLGVTVSVP